MRAAWMRLTSSGTSQVATTSKPNCRSASATAGPDLSSRSRRQAESLTVTTAAFISGFEDVFFGLAVGLVDEAQAFHQQTLGGAGGGLLGAAGGKVDGEVPLGPDQDLVHRFVALEVLEEGVVEVAVVEIHLAAMAVVADHQRACLVAHLERLQQVHDGHLGQIAADGAVAGSLPRHLL